MKEKTIEQLLADFKRANKKRRIVLAERAGFIKPELYREYLELKISLGQETFEMTVSEIDTEEVSALDMVVAFDTTGSMSSYIDAVKKHVKELIPNMFKNSPKLRMKIIAFGDYQDMNSPQEFGKAYQESELTNDENLLIDFVINARNTYGGDRDEFYELVIKKIIDETPWRATAKKSVLLIGDNVPHKLGYMHRNLKGQNTIDWEKEAVRASRKGIQFDTLQIHPTIEWYKELSNITGGVNLNFKSSQNTSQIVEGLASVRTSKAYYAATMDSAVASGDEELIGAVKQMGTLL